MPEALFAEQRKMKILEYIQEHRQASVAELMAHFQVQNGLASRWGWADF